MPKTKYTGGGIKGYGKVIFHPQKPLVKVIMEEGEFTFHKSACPSNIRPGEWNVSINGNRSKVISLGVWVGDYVGKVKEFAHSKDQPPKPKPEQNGIDSRFYVILEVTEGPAAGMTATLGLKFWFTMLEKEIQGKTREVLALEEHPKAFKNYPLLEAFMKVTGLFSTPLPYKDNPLPMMEKTILRIGNTFGFTVENGWANNLYPIQLDEDGAPF